MFPVKDALRMRSKEHNATKVSNGVLMEFLSKVNPASIMKKLSVVVIPSLCPEPSPYVLIESMMYGKLIIAPDIGGIPEMVNGNRSGVKLTKSGDYKEIADGLTSFLTLKLEEVNEIGVKNREFILQKFKNEEIAKSFTSVLDEIS